MSGTAPVMSGTAPPHLNWSPMAVDTSHAWAFVAGIHWPLRYTLHRMAAEGERPPIRYVAMEPSGSRWGLLTSIDAGTGAIRWQRRTPEPLIGGVLVTAGGLVFSGEGDGTVDAFDSATGRLLWSQLCEAGANAPPITYELDGVLYLAIVTGGNQLFGFKQGQTLHVFALGAKEDRP
jgi:hypothetical protein